MNIFLVSGWFYGKYVLVFILNVVMVIIRVVNPGGFDPDLDQTSEKKQADSDPTININTLKLWSIYTARKV